MSKTKTRFKCTNCERVELKWAGKCPGCQQWNTLEEVMVSKSSGNQQRFVSDKDLTGEAYRLHEIQEAESGSRITTGMSEFDRVLGGGIVHGSLTLVSGEPGIGKSTILLQTTGNLAEEGPVLYVSGEESPRQVKLRAERLGIDSENIYLMGETNVELICNKIRELKPKLAIIDSIQTTYDPNSNSAAGNISQIKECTNRFMELANTTDIPIFLVGHVRKDGDIAGPRNLEHMVDVVLLFEGDRQQQLRILRTEKNRFGSTNEVGIFEMANEGLVEVTNPSEFFISEHDEVRSGSAVVVTLEGTRPLLAEVQALVVPTTFNYPKRMASGVDLNRLVLLSAVLERKIGLPLGRYDIYVNVVGGLRIPETSVDLAITFAVASSLKDTALPPKTAVLGEIGLTGEIRNIPQLERRIKEAQQLGWEKVIVPKQSGKMNVIEGIELVEAKSVKEAFTKVWGSNF